MVALEHRYYGESHPFKTLTSDNLRYLSSQQALHDLANFIANAPDFVFPGRSLSGSKWIIVGGSYPANLAAWFRLKFPHLVVGAWASSAPVLAKSDYWEYDAVVGQQLGVQCAQGVQNVTQLLEALLESGDSKALDKAKRLFHPEMDAIDNIPFLYILADIVAYAVQVIIFIQTEKNSV